MMLNIFSCAHLHMFSWRNVYSFPFPIKKKKKKRFFGDSLRKAEKVLRSTDCERSIEASYWVRRMQAESVPYSLMLLYSCSPWLHSDDLITDSVFQGGPARANRYQRRSPKHR